jgi:nitrite reductase/ring-hydroxylating ferredoxin subunit
MELQAIAIFNLAGMVSLSWYGIGALERICSMDHSFLVMRPEACKARVDSECTALVDDLHAPEPKAFAKYPASWYYVCTSKSLHAHRLMGVTLCGRRLVVFRSERGMAGALEAWCPHIGSDMSLGRVVGDTVECPNHRFRFDASGACANQDLRAKAYPVVERFGAVFVFLGPKPLFPLPSFSAEIDLVSAKPMQWVVSTDWYMLVANPFDARHFAGTHDRRLVRPPSLRSPHEFALHIDIDYEITGRGWTDRATRSLSGAHVRLEVTAWGGNIVVVRAAFAKDQSFGILIVEPRYDMPGNEHRGAQVTVIVSAIRRGTSLMARILDALTVRAKRFAIGRFLTQDAKGVQRLKYAPSGLRVGDETLAQFLRWVAGLPQSAGHEPRQPSNGEE